MTTPIHDEIEKALDRLLAPYERWADNGYAEGVIDFLPSLSRTPLLITPGSVVKVFEASFDGLDKDDPEAKDEAERRTDFVERLMNGMMTRETKIRDRYYAARNRGMVHRTVVMLGAIGLFTAAAVSLPTWGWVIIGGALASAGAVTYHRLATKVEDQKGIYLFEERAARIVAELPWMRDRERIAPREPLGDV